MIQKFLILTGFSATSLFASVYSLEYSTFGTSVNSVSSQNYQIVYDMSKKDFDIPAQSYAIEEEEYAYLKLFTDMLTGDSAILLNDGAEIVDGWKKAGWFGIFYSETYPWIYHEQLQWIYVEEAISSGAWVHRENIGWLWTSPQIFPSLYAHDQDKWTYLSPDVAMTSLYDYAAGEWFELDKPYSIFTDGQNNVGGDVAGLGYYYRWQPVKLEARAEKGYQFSNWSGDLSGNNSFLQFEATRDLFVSANFKYLNTPTPTPTPTPVENNVPKPLTLDDLTPSDREKALAEILIYGESPTFGIKN